MLTQLVLNREVKMYYSLNEEDSFSEIPSTKNEMSSYLNSGLCLKQGHPGGPMIPQI